LSDSTLTVNLHALADAHYRAQPAAYQANDESERLQQKIADCDARIERYRAAPDAGTDPALVAGWIDCCRCPPDQRGSATATQQDQIAAVVDGLGSLLDVLRVSACA
jgi:hypothetical protein